MGEQLALPREAEDLHYQAPTAATTEVRTQTPKEQSTSRGVADAAGRNLED